MTVTMRIRNTYFHSLSVAFVQNDAFRPRNNQMCLCLTDVIDTTGGWAACSTGLWGEEKAQCLLTQLLLDIMLASLRLWSILPWQAGRAPVPHHQVFSSQVGGCRMMHRSTRYDSHAENKTMDATAGINVAVHRCRQKMSARRPDGMVLQLCGCNSKRLRRAHPSNNAPCLHVRWPTHRWCRALSARK